MSADVPAPEFFHKLYGFTLRVNQRLPGLAMYEPASHVPANPHDTALTSEIDSQSAIRVELPESSATVDAGPPAETAVYVSEHIGDFGTPILKIYDLGERGFRLCYDDGTEFLVSRDGTTIRGTWPPSMTFEDTVTYLVGPVMGFVLHLRQKLCFHASVVAMEGHAVVLLGAAGAGKSTTAAAFSRLGFPVLSDDVAVLDEKDDERDGKYIVLPGYQRICLTPEAAQSFYGAHDALPTITPNWEKRGLDLGHPHAPFESRALLLGAIYLLGERRADSKAAQIEPLSPQESLLELLAHTYVQYFLTPEQRAAEFPATARLAARVPMRRVFGPEVTGRPEGAERLAEMCVTLAEDFALVLGPRVISR